MKKAKMAPPTEEGCAIGPLARLDLRDALDEQIQRSIAAGARCLLGGAIPKELEGSYYPATVLTDVGPRMPAHDEELFGPVAAVFTSDRERGWRITREELGAFGIRSFVNIKTLWMA